jgi:hypothetical protein
MAILLRGDSSDVPPAMLRRAQPIDGHEMMREHAEQGTIFERLMGKVDG